MHHAADHQRRPALVTPPSAPREEEALLQRVARRPVESLSLWHVRPATSVLQAELVVDAADSQRDRSAEARRWPIEALPLLAGVGDCVAVALPSSAPLRPLLEALTIARSARLLTIVQANDALTAEHCAALARRVDAVALEFAPFDERTAAGRERAHQLRDRLACLRAAGVWVEVTTPITTTLPPAALLETALSLAAIDAAIPWHLRLASAATPPTALAPAVVAATRAGLQHVYAVAAPGDDRELTFCPVCRDQVVIARFRGQPVSFLGAGARCPRCRTRTAGLFEPVAVR